MNLKREANLIQKRLNGQILYHQAWRVTQAELRKPLRFAISDSDFPLYNDGNNTPSKLSGTLTITLAHYFNTNLQLILTEPSSRIKPYLKPQANPCWHGNLCYFSFQGETRTRSQVLNYLDHPLYGALIKITRTVG